MAVDNKYRNGIWLAILLSISGIYFVFKTIPRFSLSSGPPRLNWFYLGIGFIVLLAVWLAKSFRMYLIGNGMEAKISIRRYFQIYMATCFISHVTPFNSGGTPLQIYLLNQQGITVGKASALTVVDVGINTIIFFLFMSVAVIHQITSVFNPTIKQVQSKLLLLNHQQTNRLMFWAFLIVIIILLGIILFFFRNYSRSKKGKSAKSEDGPGGVLAGIRSFLQKKGWLQHLRREYGLFKEGWQSLARQNPARVIGAVLMTAFYWLCYLSLAPLIMAALGKPVSFTGLMGQQLLFNLVQIFIPTPGGSGGSELIMSYLFRNITGPASIGWFVLLWKIYTFFSTLIIGGYFFIRMVLERRKNESA